MSDLAQLEETLGRLGKRVNEIGEEIKTLVETDNADAKARLSELKTEQEKLLADVTPLLKEKEDAEMKAQIGQTQSSLEALLSQVRSGSKADLIGNRVLTASPDYQAGAFIGALVTMRNPQSMDADRVAAKATLEAVSSWQDKPAESKATLGTTDATGGWIVPNALVDELLKPARYSNIYRRLVTVREDVTAYQIDQPVRGTAPARMVVQSRGAAKENVDLAYGGYTATMYTIARIHDVANQFLKQSLGAAERDVIEELSHAAALGERYYIIDGSGTNEPYGLQSAFTYDGTNSFVTSHTASATTLAGSKATAIALAAGALAERNRTPTAAVLSATSYWAMLAEGTDNAGFFFAPAEGPTGIDAGTLVSPFGIPVYPDSALSQTDDLIVGDWKALKVYFGDSFRIDSSSVAGNRWDENETGFRGEEEIALDARAALFSGAFEKVADIVA